MAVEFAAAEIIKLSYSLEQYVTIIAATIPTLRPLRSNNMYPCRKEKIYAATSGDKQRLNRTNQFKNRHITLGTVPGGLENSITAHGGDDAILLHDYPGIIKTSDIRTRSSRESEFDIIREPPKVHQVAHSAKDMV